MKTRAKHVTQCPACEQIVGVTLTPFNIKANQPAPKITQHPNPDGVRCRESRMAISPAVVLDRWEEACV
jgi:hypothetical protein